jgi:hypothetical protein
MAELSKETTHMTEMTLSERRAALVAAGATPEQLSEFDGRAARLRALLAADDRVRAAKAALPVERKHEAELSQTALHQQQDLAPFQARADAIRAAAEREATALVTPYLTLLQQTARERVACAERIAALERELAAAIEAEAQALAAGKPA